MRPVLEAGKDILCLCFSSALSTTYQSAVIAARELEETASARAASPSSWPPVRAASSSAVMFRALSRLYGSEIAFQEFYSRVRAGAMPVTSAVNVGEFDAAMRPILEAGKDILCLCSPGISPWGSAAPGCPHGARA